MKKVALVIGNSQYPEENYLKNPVNDALAMDTALISIDFNVSCYTDCKFKDFKKYVKEFGKKARGADMALFYFSGHGMQYKGTNYLVPIDSEINEEEDIHDETVSLARIEARISDANPRLALFILDACRNNPYERRMRNVAASKEMNFGVMTRGLAKNNHQLTTQSIFAYATAPNETADDNPKEDNGIFTKHLLRHLVDPGLRVNSVFMNTTRDVRIATEGKQIPWVVQSLDHDDFYFIEEYTLSITSDPPGATVELIDTEKLYSEGMKLAPGEYKYLMKLEGYNDYHGSLDFQKDTEREVVLSARTSYKLKIDTDPSEAKVVLLDVDMPYFDDIELAPGVYDYEVGCKGYISQKGKLELENDLDIKVKLMQKVFSLTIISDPPGAAVKLIGTEELYTEGMKLAPGEYKYHIELEGYYDFHGSLEFQKDTKLVVPLAGRTSTLYKLKIDTDPSDAKVQLLNVDMPYYDGIMLKPGSYDYTVSHEHCEPHEGTVHLQRDIEIPVALKCQEGGKVSYLSVAAVILLLAAGGWYASRVGGNTPPMQEEKKEETTKTEKAVRAVRTTHFGFPPTLQPTVQTPPEPTTFSLTVRPTPSDANVYIMNIVPRYQDGMMLEKGAYDVKVVKSGYKTYRETITLSEDRVYPVKLEPDSQDQPQKDHGTHIEPAMAYIKPGSFQMGSNDGDSDEKPVHRVAIQKGFYLGRTEVTVGEFRKFINATGHRTDGGCYVYTGSWEKRSDASWRDPKYSQNDDHSVVCVSHEDSQAYTKWLSHKTGKRYRLPSEAEWEYAARAGTTTKWSFGDSDDQICGYGNLADTNTDFSWKTSCNDGHARTAPIGSYKMNPWGMYDMHGNVWEWCADWYTDRYSNTPRDGSENKNGNQKYRILRGGSWYYVPNFLRSANRNRGRPSYRGGGSGFRLARD